MKLIKVNRFSVILMAVTVLALGSCKKGDIGPEGPQGIQGEKGDKGDKGAKGNTGNANVKSRTFLPANITWRQTTLFSTNYVTASLSVPEITADIIANGMVMVYGGFFWGDPWSALPISYFESGRTVNFSYGIKSGSVTLRMHYSSNAVPTAPGIQFRVVVVEGQAAQAAMQEKLQLNDYHQVAAFFKLE